MDRALLIQKQRGGLEPGTLDVYVVALAQADLDYAARLASSLRAGGLRVGLDPGEARLDARLKKAARRRARVALIIGPDERARNEAVVRDMNSKTQVTVSEAEIVSSVMQTVGRA